MTDNDLYPCPFCRGEQVWCDDLVQLPSEETVGHFIVCDSCKQRGPVMPTKDDARQVYNVVAKLIDDVMNAYSYPSFDRQQIVDAFASGIAAFFQARREHPPY